MVIISNTYIFLILRGYPCLVPIHIELLLQIVFLREGGEEGQLEEDAFSLSIWLVLHRDDLAGAAIFWRGAGSHVVLPIDQQAPVVTTMG